MLTHSRFLKISMLSCLQKSLDKSTSYTSSHKTSSRMIDKSCLYISTAVLSVTTDAISSLKILQLSSSHNSLQTIYPVVEVPPWESTKSHKMTFYFNFVWILSLALVKNLLSVAVRSNLPHL